MARDAATIQAQIDALSRAIGSGVLKVRHGESEMVYQSVEGMLKAKAALEAELAGIEDSPVRQVRLQTSKGF